MRKIKLYIAQSINGKIAKLDKSVEWLEKLPNPEKNDYGYSNFLDTIDTTIQGFNTYQQIIDWGIEFPYATKKNYVLTRKRGLKNTEYVEFISDKPLDSILKIKQLPGKDIWLIGGGQANTMLLNAGLIDEIHLFIMPIIIEKGIELFELLPKQTLLKLISSEAHSSGAIEIIYKVINQ